MTSHFPGLPDTVEDRWGQVGITVEGRSGTVAELGGCPQFAWGLAPRSLATRRQLRAAGRRPGRGARPVAVVAWRRGRREAGLFPVAQSVPRTPASPGVLASLDRARTALRTCAVCGTDVGYRLPGRWDRVCLSCQGPDDAA